MDRHEQLKVCLDGMLCARDTFSVVGPSAADWMVERLRWHKVIAYAAHLNDWQAPKITALEKAFRDCCIQSLVSVERYRRQVETLFIWLEKENIRFIPYKGPFWSELLYPHYGWRHVGDIDLLMSRDDAWRLGMQLKKQGFVPDVMGKSEEEDFAERGAMTYLPGRNLSGKVPVQAHWQLLSAPRFVDCGYILPEDFLQDTRRASWGKVEFDTPKSTIILFYLLLHATCQHQFDRFVQVLDITQLLHSGQIDWVHLQHLAITRRCSVAVCAGLIFLQKFSPLPRGAAHLIQSIRPNLMARFCAGFLTADSARLATATTGRIHRRLFRLAMSMPQPRQLNQTDESPVGSNTQT